MQWIVLRDTDDGKHQGKKGTDENKELLRERLVGIKAREFQSSKLVFSPGGSLTASESFFVERRAKQNPYCKRVSPIEGEPN